jgi:hypothetical protein
MFSATTSLFRNAPARPSITIARSRRPFNESTGIATASAWRSSRLPVLFYPCAAPSERRKPFMVVWTMAASVSETGRYRQAMMMPRLHTAWRLPPAASRGSAMAATKAATEAEDARLPDEIAVRVVAYAKTPGIKTRSKAVRLGAIKG